ncbi:MAG: hypothetical protein AAFN07_00515 [Pseudomonadota bacterium]
MSIKTTTIAVVAFFACQNAWSACNYPKKIFIPNGTVATEDEMLEGQKAVKQYMVDMNAFLDCLEAESTSAVAEGEDPEITVERETIRSKRHNAAVDEMETVASDYNEAVRAYKARQQ